MMTYTRRTKMLRSNPRASAAVLDHELVIRAAGPDDAPAIRRLAALDSAEAPEGALLLAEVGGEAWAALALGDGTTVADPFRPSAHLVGLLRMRAAQLSSDPAAPRGRAVRALSPQRAV